MELQLAELVALLGEGHSRVSLPGIVDPMTDVPRIMPAKEQRLALRVLPVRLRWFTDGVFIIASTPEWRRLVGARVVGIGGHPVDSALLAIQPFVSRDNDMGFRLNAPQYATAAEVLSSTGIVASADRVALELERPDGSHDSVVLAPIASGNEPTWVDRAGSSTTMMATAQHNMEMQYFMDSRTLVVRVHVIGGTPDESVALFAARLDAANRATPVDRFVLDLRGCHGGNNQEFRALLLEIIRNGSFDRLGATFTLIDRDTFSAAVNAASDMERLSNALFVGEPTSGAPSSWGDPHRITLPNSGLVTRISTVYWRDWTTDESRPWIAPDLAAPVSSADFFAGRDVAMQRVVRFPKGLTFARLLQTLVNDGAGLETIERLHYQHLTDPRWAVQSPEQAAEDERQYDDLVRGLRARAGVPRL